ncbi:hypothetical protein [Tepidimonas charontis]|uniref:hypothetical protein n=1 Tax=Tepidimonas charontis TaxID=2267262 RepID=UPI001186C2D7|nr:hypothetical protein [Tepidimonas charontis]
MSATLAISALLTLKDQFSAPLRAAASSLDGMRGVMDRWRSSSERLSAAIAGVSNAASRMGTTAAQLAAVGQVVTGFGLESYMRQAIGVEHRLAALGNTANMSADELAALDVPLTGAALKLGERFAHFAVVDFDADGVWSSPHDCAKLVPRGGCIPSSRLYRDASRT